MQWAGRLLVAVMVIGALAPGVGTAVSAGPPGQPERLVPLERNWEAAVAFSPDSSTIVYRTALFEEDGDAETLPPEELFAIPAAGGLPTRLAGSDTRGTTIGQHTVSADGSTVVYVADPSVRSERDVYAVPIEGGPITQLTDLGAEGLAVDTLGLQVSPDSTWVLFHAGGPNGPRSLYSVPIGGGEIARLGPSTAVQGERVISGATITPDASHVVFRLHEEDGGPGVVLSVPIDGSAEPTRLTPHGDAVVSWFRVTPDGRRLVYRSAARTGAPFHLFSVPLEGGAPTRLHPDLPEGAEVTTRFGVSPDSSTVVYEADLQGDGVAHLYSIPVEGGDEMQLTGARIAGDSIIWHPADIHERIVYRTDSDRRGREELYSVPVTGGDRIRLNGDLASGRNVREWRVAPDGNTVLYVADERSNNTFENFLVATTGGVSTPIAESRLLIASFTPDSSMALLLRSSDVSAFGVEAAGSVDLTNSLDRIERLHVSPDSRYVVVAADGGLHIVDLPGECDGHLATITGTDGPDTLTGTDGRDVFVGLGGDDHISGLAAGDVICGGPGDDVIDGDMGRDQIFGQSGNDIIRGGDGSDRISGGRGDDVIRGGGSSDTILGRSGDDRIFGGPGDDVLRGNSGQDRLSGGKGDDVLSGGPGDDRLRGRSGADLLYGNRGSDDLGGGSGADRCRGGPGLDVADRCEQVTRTP